MSEQSNGPLSYSNLRLFLRRIGAEIRYSPELGAEVKTKARLMLNDFSTQMAVFFSESSLPSGQSIVLSLYSPQLQFFHGKILTCSDLDLQTRVISECPMRFRIQVQLEPKNEQELKAIEEYYQRFILPNTQQGAGILLPLSAA